MKLRLKSAADLVTSCHDTRSRPFLALEHLEGGTGRLLAGVELPERTAPETGVAAVDTGNVLFGKLRPYLAKTWLADRPVFASTELLCLCGRSNVDSRWLAYACASRPFVEWAVATSDGTKMPRTSWEKLAEFRLEIPSLSKQRGIADFLDAETARIDALIEKKRRMIILLGERWRSAVSRCLNDIMAKHGTIPLRHVVKCLDGQRIPLNSEQRATRQGTYPYYGASEVVDYVDDYIFNEELVLVGEDGAQLGDPTLLISQRVSGPVWVNNHAHVLRPLAVDANLLVLHLNTFDRVPYMSGGTREKITQDDMNRIPVPNVPLDKQAAVAANLSTIVGACYGSMEVLGRQIALIQERRQVLITAAVTGELEIPGVAA